MRGCEVNATMYIWRSEDNPCMGSRAQTQAVRLSQQAEPSHGPFLCNSQCVPSSNPI